MIFKKQKIIKKEIIEDKNAHYEENIELKK